MPDQCRVFDAEKKLIQPLKWYYIEDSIIMGTCQLFVPFSTPPTMILENKLWIATISRQSESLKVLLCDIILLGLDAIDRLGLAYNCV